MKRASALYAAMSALALAIFCAGLALLYAQAGAYEIKQYTAFGSPEAAEGVVVKSSAVFQNTLEINTVHDLAAGADSSAVGWTGGASYVYPAESCGVDLVARLSAKNDWYGQNPDLYCEFDEKVYNAAIPGHEIETHYYTELDLGEITDRVPLYISFRTEGGFCNIDGAEEFLPVGLPGDAKLFVSYIIGGNAMKTLNYGPADGGLVLSSNADAVFTESWAYFTFELRHDGTRELLDGSRLPGGDWGVWRAPYDGEREIDLSRVECVYTLGRGFDSCNIAQGGEGELFIIVCRSGGAELVVLDTETLEYTEPVVLFAAGALGGELPDGYYTYFDAFPGREAAVVAFYGSTQNTAVVLRRSADGYVPAFTAAAALEHVPERFAVPETLRRFTARPVDFLTDGERLFTLYNVSGRAVEGLGGIGEPMLRAWAVSVCDSEGLLSVEWLAPPSALCGDGRPVIVDSCTLAFREGTE